MEKNRLNHEIFVIILQLVEHPSERLWAEIYRCVNQHPQLNKNQNRIYPNEIFREGEQEAWAIFSLEQIQKLLSRLEAQGVEITVENSDRLVTALITHLNAVIRNKTIDIWRKETYCLF